MSYKVVSLFSGCGGFNVGFKEKGFDLIYACDIDPIAVECYKRNMDPRAYVRDVREDAFRQDILLIGSADVILGGFPCQGFSKAGPKRLDDSRNLLYREMKYAVETLRPKIFVAENVDGLYQNFRGMYLEKIVNDFREIGYTVRYNIIDAVSFGVAQHRRRIFFVGIKDSLTHVFEWPVNTHKERHRNGEKKYQINQSTLDRDPELLQIKTISDALDDLVQLNPEIPDHMVTNRWPTKYQDIFKKIKQGQKLCNVRHASTSVYTWEIPEVFGYINERQIEILNTIAKNRRHKKYGSKPNGNPLSVKVIEELLGLKIIQDDIQDLIRKGYLKEENAKFDLKGAMFCSGLFKRPRWDQPSQTVLTNFHNPRYFLHPIEDRPFSARECARLQGFPDTFLFSWENFFIPLEDRYRLIGNAVAIPVSRAMANSVYKFLLEERILNNEDSFKTFDPSRTVVGI